MSRLRRIRRALAGAAVALGCLCALPATASAVIVERIVAVVGDRPILLSDLRDRARPFLLDVYENTPNVATRSATISQVLKDVLELMIDEELQKREAIRANIVVTSEEIDRAIGIVAKQNNITPEDLIAEAMRKSLSEKEYREQLRLQLLQQKLMSLRLQGRIRVTEDDARNAYRSLVLRERAELAFRAAWIVLKTFDGPPSQAQAKRAQADRLARQARSGADFSRLAQQFSDDSETKATGGLLPQMKLRDLPNALARAAVALEVGEVSAPIRVGNDLIILKMLERAPSRLPPYEQARPTLLQRVENEKALRAHKHWMESLRRRTHVEVRL